MFKFKNNYSYSETNLISFMQDAIDEPVVFLKGKSKKQYANLSCSYDSETSSFYSSTGKKVSCMYLWGFGINGSTIYGRTWDGFLNTLSYIKEYLHLTPSKRIIIYVHNLGYDFQYFRKWLKFSDVFSMDKRRPIYAVSDCFEFRCSYFLSNCSLAHMGDELCTMYPVSKKVGDLDYSLLRTYKTKLTEKEIGYFIGDLQVPMSYIQEKIETEGGITKIPYTNTGYVRNYCRNYVFATNESENPISDPKERKKAQLQYRDLMTSLQLNDVQEYEELKEAMCGGFTHAGVLHANELLHDIGSADFTSSYPYVMCSSYFPMTRGQYIGSVESIDLLSSLLKHKCCLFRLELVNVKPKVLYENPLSKSRCIVPPDGTYTCNNGRIITASRLLTTVTELDFNTILNYYEFDSFKVYDMYVYNRGYLPKPLIESILNLYETKTKLKDVQGEETEYQIKKGMLNATYGMMVTAIDRDEILYSNETSWGSESCNESKMVASYNSDHDRFLFYAWGIWVTAHARHNLFEAITEFKEDYVYADTDSIKGLNFSSHTKFFNDYNNQVVQSLYKMCSAYSIPFSKCSPKTIKGKTKIIGLWDMEQPYSSFKTLGAKRYMYIHDGETAIDLTMAGVKKTSMLPYLKEKYTHNDLVFRYFDNNLFIPPEHTGKMTMTYFDEPITCKIVDYQGNVSIIYEKSYVHSEKQGYFLSQTHEYLDLLKGVKNIEY